MEISAFVRNFVGARREVALAESAAAGSSIELRANWDEGFRRLTDKKVRFLSDTITPVRHCDQKLEV